MKFFLYFSIGLLLARDLFLVANGNSAEESDRVFTVPANREMLLVIET